jgi:hypothetical protein
MNWTREQTAALANVILAKAKAVQDKDPDRLNPDIADGAECLRVLARMIQGKSLYESFGAPGSWGYGTTIGDALSKLYKLPAKEESIEFRAIKLDNELLYKFKSETVAAFKPVQDWYDGDGDREWIPEMIREAVEDLQRDREAIVAALPAIKEYVTHFGPKHEDDCPGDDTCSCAFKPMNDGINRAIDKLEGRP